VHPSFAAFLHLHLRATPPLCSLYFPWMAMWDSWPQAYCGKQRLKNCGGAMGKACHRRVWVWGVQNLAVPAIAPIRPLLIPKKPRVAAA
jgi:hypothetical protein